MVNEKLVGVSTGYSDYGVIELSTDDYGILKYTNMQFLN